MKICPTCGLKTPAGEVCPHDGVRLRDLPKDPLVGRMLKGRYRLDEHVAHGGMGIIYKATQVTLNRTVAVKVLLEGLNDSEEHVARFRQEADLLSRIIHPNVVALQDYGQEEGLLFMVMEFLEGQTLDGLVPAGGLSLDASLAIMEEVCAGVGAAHQAGLIHRDLKPENIFMARQKDGRSFVKVIDFGLARAAAGVQETASELTMRGRVVGSAGFVAPEHITGSRDFAPASDIYALGATLYFALTGKTPHAGNDNVAIMTSQLRNIAPPLDLPPGAPNLALEGVVQRAMNRDPALRYKNTAEMLAAMHYVVKKAGQLGKSRTNLGQVKLSEVTIQLQAPRPPPSRPLPSVPIWAVAIGCTLLGMVLFALASFAWDRLKPAPEPPPQVTQPDPKPPPSRPPRRRR